MRAGVFQQRQQLVRAQWLGALKDEGLRFARGGAAKPGELLRTDQNQLFLQQLPAEPVHFPGDEARQRGAAVNQQQDGEEEQRHHRQRERMLRPQASAAQGQKQGGEQEKEQHCCIENPGEDALAAGLPAAEIAPDLRSIGHGTDSSL